MVAWIFAAEVLLWKQIQNKYANSWSVNCCYIEVIGKLPKRTPDPKK